ncbi:MAG: formylglycine-generating enzyme family protein, partial [Gemmataceae bacterium]|nr:formylglycine-generating enzyme family protein [Gemmataceae bacterium]
RSTGSAPTLDRGHHGAVVNSIGMGFAPIPAGTFLMGSDYNEPGRRPNEFIRHEVTLPAAFHLGVTPVTQGQYLLVMGHNPAQFNETQGGSLDHPVESVSWEDAVEFCRRLSQLPEEQAAGRVYRLPTEAEWESACRAGTRSPYACGNELLQSQARFAAQAPTRVGRFAPNGHGLFDMHGNVWEWCADLIPGNPAGALRVLRGGSWRSRAEECRSAARHALPATARVDDVGFRVVMEIHSANDDQDHTGDD